MTELWKRHLIDAQRQLDTAVAPVDAFYWTAKANSVLTNETNLAALSTGYLRVSTGTGQAIPSTTATLPSSDLSGALPALDGSALTTLNASQLASGTVGLARGGTNADLSATGGTSQVLQQASAGAAVTVGQLASTDVSGLASGTYTPTLTPVANLDASTAYSCQYCRLGAIVLVSGRVDVDPTAGATLTQLGISLPIASNFANANECAGTASAPGVSGQTLAIRGDATTDRAELAWTAVDTTNQATYFVFSYRII